MDKLLEMLGVQKLDEKNQEAIKEKLNTLIELKAKEAVDEIIQTEKEKLVEEYEEKFDAYKEDITSKFSTFVDEILEKEMVIPERVIEFARKGELYSDLIEQFKVRLGVDEGLLDEEIKSLLKEAKEEIQDLRNQLDSSIAEKLEVKNDAQDLAAELYTRRKCDGLTTEQLHYVVEMLDGIKDKDEIDRKFDIVVEAYNGKMDNKEEETDEEKKKKEEEKKKMKEKMKEDTSEDGKGKVINEDENLDEEDKDNPFNAYLNLYKKVLQENKV